MKKGEEGTVKGYKKKKVKETCQPNVIHGLSLDHDLNKLII